MIRKYIIFAVSKTIFKDGTKVNGFVNGTISIRYTISDNESLGYVEKMMAKDVVRKNPEIESVDILISSFQLVSTNPC